MLKQQGLSILDLLVGTLCLSSLILIVSSAYKVIILSSLNLQSKLEIDSEVISLYKHLMMVGTHSLSCQVMRTTEELASLPVSPGSSIVCQVDMTGTVPPVAATNVSFTFDSSNRRVNYYLGSSSNPALTYHNINRLSICDEQAMGFKNGTNDVIADRCLFDSCDSIERISEQGKEYKVCHQNGLRLGKRFVENLKGNFSQLPSDRRVSSLELLQPKPGRFFRFQILGGAPSGRSAILNFSAFQGAFYIRNPTPVSLGYNHYLWGREF